MRKEIEEIKVKTDNEHRNIMSSEGMELVPLMKDKQTGEDCIVDLFCTEQYSCHQASHTRTPAQDT